jgi:hypothetical protein
MKKLYTLLLLLTTLLAHAQSKHKTTVGIDGENFTINGQLTFKGKSYKGMKIEGLLPNSRMVQGIFDDYNPISINNWIYPDTKKWDAERNTNEFIAAMPDWKKHGLLAFTLSLQGGSPFGYSQSQPWINTAFKPNGSLDEAYMKRLERIIDKADEIGMVVILCYFYFGQDEKVENTEGVKDGVIKATRWVLEKGYTNVVIEINNECDINEIASPSGGAPYNHAILDATKVHELINLAKLVSKDARRLLVSTSFKGGGIPSDNVLEVADFVLIHGNGVSKPELIEDMIKQVREKKAYKGSPIVINEDDHFDFDKPYNNFIAATKNHVSWGYFDYRMKGEGYNDGFQSIPANWKISSTRKKGFFDLLKRMTH